METAYPIISKRETKDGWTVAADYGPRQGRAEVRVKVREQSGETRAENREKFSDTLARLGYRLER